jgi:tRNA A-37 threonylcarbamoyl transferase component Bud32
MELDPKQQSAQAPTIERSQAEPEEIDGLPAEVGPGSILGSYRILDVLGEGGFGQVFLAEHMAIGRRVALKLLRPEHASNRNSVARFFGEARAVNKIAHKNIVEVTDLVQDVEGRAFIIMELLQGITLAQLMGEIGRVPVPRAIAIARQIAKALGAAHAQGVIHRDLKPENVFLVEQDGVQDFVKLMDFGVAKLVSDAPASERVTREGMLVGTPGYMAPEQARGDALDHRADIYAFGLLLYEIISGSNPMFGASVLETLTNQVQKRAPALERATREAHQITPRLSALVASCIAKDPHKRPQEMRHVLVEFEEIDREIARGATVRKPRHLMLAVAILSVLTSAAALTWMVAAPTRAQIEAPKKPAVPEPEESHVAPEPPQAQEAPQATEPAAPAPKEEPKKALAPVPTKTMPKANASALKKPRSKPKRSDPKKPLGRDDVLDPFAAP